MTINMYKHRLSFLAAGIIITALTALLLFYNNKVDDQSNANPAVGIKLPKPVLPAINKAAKADTLNENTKQDIFTAIAKQEYHVTFDEVRGAYQSPNRNNNIRAVYAPGKLSLQNRVDSANHNWQGSLQVKGLYANNNLIANADDHAVASLHDNTIEYNHGAFTEQYVNTEAGLRQNFIITQPSGEDEVSIALSANGLTVNKAEGGATLTTEDGQVYTYNDLKVWDANNQPLTATMQVINNEILLTANVANAAYPVTIDPIVQNGQATSLMGTQYGGEFGGAVSIAGDVNGDGFDDVIIGSRGYDGGQVAEGAAFIYHGSASGISTTATIRLERNVASALMGNAVSGAGDVNGDGYDDVIVGANGYTNGQNEEGAFYVYNGSATGITSTPSRAVESNVAGTKLGWDVSAAGDVNADGYSDIIVGVYTYTNGQTNEGAAFVYYGSSTGIPSAYSIMLEGNVANAYFGNNVSDAGDINADGYGDIIIGSSNYTNGQSIEGAVYIYYGGPLGITTIQSTIIQSNRANTYFGDCISAAGDVNGDGYDDIMVGAAQYTNGQNFEGAVWIYHGSATGISTVAATMFESNIAEARLGATVTNAGDLNGDGYDDVLVSAYGYVPSPITDGAFQVHYGRSIGLNPVAAVKIIGPDNSGTFGEALGGNGDINGDGRPDIVVGAYSTYLVNGDATTRYYGAFYVYHSTGIGVGDFRSMGSGTWDDPATWQRYNGSTWVAAGAGQFPTAADNVFIQTGHVVTLIANAACKTINISKGTSSSNTVKGTVNLDAYTLSVDGNMRSYYSALNTIPGTTSNAAYANYAFTGTGKVSLTGASRFVMGKGVWSAAVNTPATGSFNIEVNAPGKIIRLWSDLKFTNLTVTAGTLDLGVNTVSIDDGSGTSGTGDVTIAPGATLISARTGTTNVFQKTASLYGGTLTVNGHLILKGAAPQIAMATVNFTGGTVTYNSTAAQTAAIAGTGATATGIKAYGGLTLNNASGLSLTAGSATVANSLILTNGKITTGTDTLKMLAGATVSGASATKYIIGYLQKNTATGSNVARTYEVGTASAYTPVTLTHPSVTSAGDIVVKAFNGAHPAIATTPVDAAKKLNRYWYVGNNTVAPFNYTATLNYVAADNDAAATPAKYAAAVYNGTAWENAEYSATGTPTTTTGTFSNITKTGDLVIGESKSITINTKLFIEGYYAGGGLMNAAMYNNGLSQNPTDVDTVSVELHATTGGLATLATATGVLQTNGSITGLRVSAASGITIGNSYYIAIKHRNSIPVWSAVPVAITAGMTYDFSNALSKAYGDNMKADGSVFMIYSGDVNGDGYIDAQDVGETDNDNANFAFGVLRTDVNGDGFVDAQDVGITDNNNASFIAVVYPSGYAGTGRVQQRPPVKVPAKAAGAAKAVQKAGDTGDKPVHHAKPAYYTNLKTTRH